MSMHDTIQSKLTQAVEPSFMNIENESHMHSGPATESHFKVTVVSDIFDGKMLIARHRMINEALKQELEGNIHALTLHTMTPSEYEDKGGIIPESPTCQGGGKS